MDYPGSEKARIRPTLQFQKALGVTHVLGSGSEMEAAVI
jgi:hypothetical protein